MYVQKKYNLFIEIIRSLLKSSVTGATPKIAKRTMHILKKSKSDSTFRKYIHYRGINFIYFSNHMDVYSCGGNRFSTKKGVFPRFSAQNLAKTQRIDTG